MSKNESYLKARRNIPFVYCLTSEVDEPVLEQLKNVGFKAIYSMLNTGNMKEILENAGLEFRQV